MILHRYHWLDLQLSNSPNTSFPFCAPPFMPDTPTIETREEVMFFDTDCGGVVHNIAYLRMIETARTRLATKLRDEAAG
jgi:acyl-CoA thioesterase FadM